MLTACTAPASRNGAPSPTVANMAPATSGEPAMNSWLASWVSELTAARSAGSAIPST